MLSPRFHAQHHRKRAWCYMLVVSELRRWRQGDHFKVILNCGAVSRLAYAKWDTISTLKPKPAFGYTDSPPLYVCMHTYRSKNSVLHIFLSHSPLSSLKVFWIIIFIAFMWVVGICAYESRYLQRPESPGAAATGACELLNLGVVNTLNHWMSVRVPYFTWNSVTRLDWLVCKPQGSSCLCLNGAGVESGFRPSCLYLGNNVLFSKPSPLPLISCF